MTRYLSGHELRQTFVGFFRERGHLELPSMSLVPADDPSVLFVTAGMQQIIPFFVGERVPPSKRLVSVQKCLRTVDIEEVGDPAHLTFFEMLGNFSVGDYFVKEAIQWTWEFLIDILKLPLDRLWATVYPGDELARRTWLDAGMPTERVIDDPSNWWTRAGLAGPAGPDSEVHFDRGEQFGCGEPDCNPLCERCERYVEVWNNVFMQSYVNERNEVLRPLEYKNIDTGQGFDRMLMVVQGKETVYETDVFQTVLDAACSVTGHAYGDDPAIDKSLRVIVDHSRSLTMAMADGALPGNEGRNYVLRRLLRRAVLRGRLMGAGEPFMTKPIAAVIETMKSQYPEVEARAETIMRMIEIEEERFAETLARGLPLLEELIASAPNGTVRGQDAFLMHDTYGLPIELIQELAAERNIAVDIDAFNAALAEQQVRARSRRSSSGPSSDTGRLDDLLRGYPPTEFLGYSELTAAATVLSILKDGATVDKAAAGDDVGIVLDRSPFYAEAGGQVGDSGEIRSDAALMRVRDTQKIGTGVYIHFAEVESGSLRVEDNVRVAVDTRRRGRIRSHHSATHLLHLALHEVLGNDATQAGSLVAPDRLRFDFRWPGGLTLDQMTAVERRVNELVFANEPVYTQLMSQQDAIASGAMALFGEKYGDTVRVVAMGPSRELCGGTHVAETAEVGPVVITSESGIGTGVRRVEALAGLGAVEYLNGFRESVFQAAGLLGTQPAGVQARIEDLTNQLADAERRLAALTRDAARSLAGELVALAEPLPGHAAGRYIVARVDADSKDNFLRLSAHVLEALASGVVAFGAVIDGKPLFAVSVSKDMVSRGHNAREIAKQIGDKVSGGAGGTAEFSQGGGRNADGMDAGLDAARSLILSG
jgi:alanyl-tRNA synthetase